MLLYSALAGCNLGIWTQLSFMNVLHSFAEHILIRTFPFELCCIQTHEHMYVGVCCQSVNQFTTVLQRT